MFVGTRVASVVSADQNEPCARSICRHTLDICTLVNKTCPQGKYAEADVLLARAQDALRAAHGSEHPMFVRTQSTRVKFLSRQVGHTLSLTISELSLITVHGTRRA